MNYKVYEGTTLKTTVSSRTATITGLTPNTSYIFGVIPNNGLRDGEQKTTSVTTRGIRFNIPKTLTVGSTITLRYEEYPLGIVPIGNEPSGMFGGGNKQNLSAKVISTANDSSVVEVAGNAIDVGGKNLVKDSKQEFSGKAYNFHTYNFASITELTPGETYTVSFSAKVDDKAVNYNQNVFVCVYNPSWSFGPWIVVHISTDYQRITNTFTVPEDKTDVMYITAYLQHPVINGKQEDYRADKSDAAGTGYIKEFKLEQGDVATPYAAFVDGDTFTAQPDGTYALISEYKALYY